MTISVETEGRGALVVKIVGTTSVAAGGQGALPNPEGKILMVTKTTLHVKTPSTGAANIDVGIGAAAATDATDIINALAMNGAITGKVYNGHAPQVTAKTEITGPIPWTTTGFLCITGSASLVGLEAYLFVEYFRLPA
jgi:hypothetical protein